MSQQEETKAKGGCCGGKQKQQAKQPEIKIKTNTQETGLNKREGRKPGRQRKGGAVEAKIVLLGDSGVGKSSIAMRFCQDRFDEIHDVTIGGAYLQKVIAIPNSQDQTAGE